MADHSRYTESDGQKAESGSGNDASAIAPWLLSLLACPVDHGEILVAGSALVCQRCGRRYPVRNGVPVMMPSEAEEEQKF
jgi:uncharacterized protein YbaR (Trm112 family)